MWEKNESHGGTIQLSIGASISAQRKSNLFEKGERQ
jgi:hypothetical protein